MLNLLERIPIFEECTAEELQLLNGITEKVTFPEGARVFEAGSAGDHLYLVVDGAIELRFSVTHLQDDREVTIERVLADQIFGWSSLWEARSYSLSAVAVLDTELVKMPARSIRALCAEHQHLGFVLMKNIGKIVGERLDAIQRMLIGVLQQQLDEKERRK